MSEQPNIKKNTLVSTFSLFFQSGFSAVLGLITQLILTVQLSASIFGVYFLVQSVINFLNYFSDIGLAASLIQKKEITDDDLKTTFTVQQIMIVTAITIGYLLTPFVMRFYSFPADAAYLYWALLISFFISSLKTIPSILLERDIKFQKIVFVQIIENIVFYSVVSIAALSGLGIKSITLGVITRALVGLIVMYSISFWIPKFGISMQSLKTLLAFGLPLQASSLLALLKDDFLNLILGKMLGLEAIGYIGWAKKWAEAPIRIIMDSISRVLFPVFSRIQHDKQKMASIIEKILCYQTRLLAPVMIGLALIMPTLVEIIPKYNKWAPALPMFYIFCVSAFLATYSSPFMNLFNSIGKTKIPFFFMVYWTTANWIFTLALVKIYGPIGFALTQVILALTFVVVVWTAKKYLVFNFLPSISNSLISALIMGIIVKSIIFLLGVSFLNIIIASAVGALSYFIILLTIYKINLITEFKSIFRYE